MPITNEFQLRVNVWTYKLPPECKNLFDAYKITKPFGWAFTIQNYNNTKHLLVDEGHNLVVDVGMQQIIDLMIATNTNSFTHTSVGSGTNTPTAGDIALQTEITRIAVPSGGRYRTGLSAAFDTFFATSDGNGTWNETGIHTAAAGGVMLCRRKFNSAFTKSTANTALVAWLVTLAAVAD